MGTDVTFLGLPEGPADRASIVLLPLPLEHTVSYRGGTAAGPAALLDASTQVELFDCETGIEIDESAGFFTAPAWSRPPTATVEGAIEDLTEFIRPFAARGAFCVGLGGEHSITVAMVRALAAVGPMTVVQIDAHADLRDSYDGSPLSHACVARRVLEMGHRLVQIGTRAMCPEEWELTQSSPDISLHLARDLAAADGRAFDRLVGELGAIEGPIYFTLDVDGLDPSWMPGTGTPVPGGLSYRQATEIIDATFRKGQVVSMDVAELSPIHGQHQSEFAAAQLLNRAVGRHLAHR